MDFDEYFYDIVGVSLNPEGKKQNVVVSAYYPAAYYIETKPIHPSQRVLKRSKESIVFQWEVIINY